MVEMIETANILNNASDRSIVVLDEVGRGTSTLDGLSLAWAIAEDLCGFGAAAGRRARAPRTLFATHYHELTELEDRLRGLVRNLHVAVREWGDEIVFLHRIEPGRADRSYGVHVAKLAGVPGPVVARARQVLDTLSVRSDPRPAAPGERSVPARDPGLFDPPGDHPALERLRELRLEDLSPIQAFDELRALADLARAAADQPA
jgi:DNA mismatch repair protein MutS